MRQCRGNHEEHRHNELVKVVMVVNPDTIINPGAVVVEPLHTALAYRAVSRATRPNHEAIWAQLSRVGYLEQVQEII